jgi:hypothetical protein
VNPPPKQLGWASHGDLIPLLRHKASTTAEAGGKKGHSYKPLPLQFRRDELNYGQIARGWNAAIYKQTWNRCRNPSISYEVIRIRRRDGFEIGGRLIEPAPELRSLGRGWSDGAG